MFLNFKHKMKVRRSDRIKNYNQRRNKACILIQKTFKKYLNTLPDDPITQDKLELPIFRLKENGSIYFFGAMSLSEYILSSGDTRNPLTRQEITLEDVKRLEDVSGKKIRRTLASVKKKNKEEYDRRLLFEYFDSVVFGICQQMIDECSQVTTTYFEKYISCKVLLGNFFLPQMVRYMQAIKYHYADNWVEKVREKVSEVVAIFDMNRMSDWYCEEEILLSLKRDVILLVADEIQKIQQNVE